MQNQLAIRVTHSLSAPSEWSLIRSSALPRGAAIPCTREEPDSSRPPLGLSVMLGEIAEPEIQGMQPPPISQDEIDAKIAGHLDELLALWQTEQGEGEGERPRSDRSSAAAGGRSAATYPRPVLRSW